MQREIAPGAEGALGALGETALERAHRDVVGDQHAVEADVLADHIVDHGG